MADEREALLLELAEELAASSASFAENGYDLEVLQLKERPGFKQFVAAHKDALKSLAGLRNEQAVMQLLACNGALVEGVAHVRAWFFDRHVAASKVPRLAANVQDEAAGLFLLDAAADAARAHFMKTQVLQGAAITGVRMLVTGLSAEGDPVGIRANLATRVETWLALVKQTAFQQKSNLKAKSKQQQQSTKAAAAKQAEIPATPIVDVAAAPVIATGAAPRRPSESSSPASSEQAVPGQKPVDQPDQPMEEAKKQDVEEGGLGGWFKGLFG